MNIRDVVRRYLAGELSEKERIAFERALVQDEMLQRLLEEKREE